MQCSAMPSTVGGGTEGQAMCIFHHLASSALSLVKEQPRDGAFGRFVASALSFQPCWKLPCPSLPRDHPPSSHILIILSSSNSDSASSALCEQPT
eukprot:365437-Chlamydomonas_euryale.AAC.3